MREVRVGMKVRGVDHARLGHVVRVDPDGLLVDKGRIFAIEFRVRRNEIVRVEEDTVVVSQHRPEIAEAAGGVKRTPRRGARRAS